MIVIVALYFQMKCDSILNQCELIPTYLAFLKAVFYGSSALPCFQSGGGSPPMSKIVCRFTC